jgi:hypothetical protein
MPVMFYCRGRTVPAAAALYGVYLPFSRQEPEVVHAVIGPPGKF